MWAHMHAGFAVTVTNVRRHDVSPYVCLWMFFKGRGVASTFTERGSWSIFSGHGCYSEEGGGVQMCDWEKVGVRVHKSGTEKQGTGMVQMLVYSRGTVGGGAQYIAWIVWWHISSFLLIQHDLDLKVYLVQLPNGSVSPYRPQPRGMLGNSESSS